MVTRDGCGGCGGSGKGIGGGGKSAWFRSGKGLFFDSKNEALWRRKLAAKRRQLAIIVADGSAGWIGNGTETDGTDGVGGHNWLGILGSCIGNFSGVFWSFESSLDDELN